MKRILIEQNEVDIAETGIGSTFNHLYLVFDEDDINGNDSTEFVLRGGASDPLTGAIEINTKTDGSETGVIPLLLNDSKDARGAESIEDRGQVLIVQGDQLIEDTWSIMEQYASVIHAAQIDYELPVIEGISIENSNATIASLLYTIGIDVHNYIPTNIDDTWSDIPGANSIFSISSSLTGTESANFIVGAGGDDGILGMGGDDSLYGDSNPNIDLLGYENDQEDIIGNDDINGGDGNDYINAGGGTDRIIFTGAFGDDTVLEGEVIVIDGDTLDGSEADFTFSEEGGGLIITRNADPTNSIFLSDWNASERSYGISANEDPTVASPLADWNGTHAVPLSITVPAGTFADADEDALTLSASLHNGAGLPSWLSFNPTTGQLAGTPPAANDNNPMLRLARVA